MILRVAVFASALMAATASFPVLAQTSAPAAAAKVNVTVGAAVTDANGGSVGTISSVAGDSAVIDTGSTKATVSVGSFAQGDKALLFGMTKAQLEAAAKGASAGQQAQFLASLKPGVAVSDQNGGAVGQIEAVDADTVTIATPSAKAKLPKASLAQGANGPVIGMTRTQLEAAAKASAPPAG